MFNAPRRTQGTMASSAFLPSVAPNPFDPLAQSTPNPTSSFDVDPWSAAPSPARSETPQEAAPTGLSALIADPPPLYLSLHDQLDPTINGDVTLSAVHRMLSTSKLPAASIEKVVNLTSRDKSSLNRQEFFCALALVALAQAGSEISIEQLASLPSLPLPQLSAPQPRSPPPFSPGISWDSQANGDSTFTAPDRNEGLDASVAAERGYWKRLETIEVTLITEKEGWFLQKYKLESDKRSAISRRYSDFVWLLETLSKRYPFRILPALPPKKLGPDAHFLEQRRRALKRFINMIVNHPVMRDDGALNVFLTETQFEAWRKRTKVSTDEESASKKLSPTQELAIPADLEERLGVLRDHLPSLLTSYQKLVVLAERSLSRLQATSADASRLALSLHTIGEEMPQCCYRNVGGSHPCSLCGGVGRGFGEIGETWITVAEESEKRAAAIIDSIEALKTQRDLYLAMRDLFVRHDKLSKDAVESLRKKVEGRIKKAEGFRSAQKPGWEVEADKLVAANELDNSNITSLLSRRVFIRACMWHELSTVFHSRQGAQATLGWRQLAKREREAVSAVARIWEGLEERLESMPVDA